MKKSSKEEDGKGNGTSSPIPKAHSGGPTSEGKRKKIQMTKPT